ncbi:MFS transporter [Streptomyces jeddahensis]|uniref:Putative multidrug resistance protein EmrY n=1 Tax=Streptomyces jeddahensis TaxID=1716141 RepID=A0A177I014_9ACTN|nr:MFS transporter [Streptomyces jeddahensis]OAH15914.1 putative multidrug resistance protein EmrY [Streptomyces jeddahensis]
MTDAIGDGGRGMTPKGAASGGPGSVIGGPGRVKAVVGLLVVFELVSGFLQGSAPALLPAVQDWQSISTAEAQWFTAIQFLAAAVSVPVFGRLGDLHGHRRLIRISLACITVGALLVAVAPNLAVLLLGRMLMGPLAALLPLEIGLVRGRLDLEGGRRAVGLLVGALTLGSLLGHGLAGPLLHVTGDIQVTLWALAALACGCLALSYCGVPESPSRAEGRMDWAGTVLLGLALVLFLGTVSRGASWGWASPLTLSGLLLAAVLMAWWVRIERDRPHALVDVRAVAGRRVAPYYVSGFVFGAVMLGGQAVAISYLAASPSDEGYGFGLATWEISMWGGVPHVLAFIGASIVARVAARTGYRRTLLFAFALMAAGSAGLMATHAVLPLFALSFAVAGFGMGLAMGGLPTVIVEGSAEDRTASATAVYNNLKTLGGSVAGAGASVVLGALVVDGTEVPALSAYLTFWGLGAVLCVLALALQAVTARQADGEGSESGIRSSAAVLNRP